MQSAGNLNEAVVADRDATVLVMTDGGLTDADANGELRLRKPIAAAGVGNALSKIQVHGGSPPILLALFRQRAPSAEAAKRWRRGNIIGRRPVSPALGTRGLSAVPFRGRAAAPVSAAG